MADQSVAFIFPGQGSQKVGMLGAAYEAFEPVRDTFAEASEVLGYDMWQLIQNGEQEALNLTETTQPVLLTASVALWRAWLDQGGVKPGIMAGHSLGEYSALVSAGSMSLSNAALLVADRGRFMQEAVPVGVGAMAAILGLDDNAVISVCEQAAESEVVTAVNFNSPGQVVIAGNAAAIDRAVDLAKEAGAKRALVLPVSVPSHCSLMNPAAEKLRERLADININSPTIPVYNNVDVQAESDPDAIRDALKRQLFSPVRWVDTINAFAKQNVQRIVECGPGKVLVGLNKRINKQMTALPTLDVDSFKKAIESVQTEG